MSHPLSMSLMDGREAGFGVKSNGATPDRLRRKRRVTVGRRFVIMKSLIGILTGVVIMVLVFPVPPCQKSLLLPGR